MWSEPVEKVATTLGLSGRGLGKICNRAEIPVPPRGYWAQLQHGYEPERVPLPPVTRGTATTVSLRGEVVDAQPFETLPSDILADLQREQESTRRIQVSERLCHPHPRVRATRDALKGATPDKYGLLSPRTPPGMMPSRVPLLNIHVARSSIARALRLADALLKALAARGFLNREHLVQLRGQSLAFHIREAVKQVDHVPTAKELETQRRWSSPHPPRWDYEPNGRLILKIDEFTRARFRKTWSDRDGSRLEEMLNDIVAGMVLVAQAKRCDEEEHQREEEQRREAERRRYELEQRRREEEARRRELDGQVERWVRSQNLRAFL